MDFFSTPDDLGEIRQSELHSSLGERLGAEIADTLDPAHSIATARFFREARKASAGGMPAPWNLSPDDPDLNEEIIRQSKAAVPDTAIADAKARVKQEGLDGHLKLPEQPSIKSPVLDLMINEAHERRDREMAIARGPQGFLPDALGLVTSLGAGMIDPVNIAAFSIPVLGEARMGKIMTSAGDSILNRTGARVLQGGLQGAAGTAALQPADWWLHSHDGVDFTFAEALKSVVMGAGMGAGFHAGFGAIGDARARWRRAPLPGSPEDMVTRALHPAEIMADLPPAAQEDLVRVAIADVTADRPVRAAEVLAIAADHDPRIAESLQPEQLGSPAVRVVDRAGNEHVRSGQIHADAFDRLRNSGIDYDPRAENESGWLTSRGRFVGRDEAQQIAKNTGLVAENATASTGRFSTADIPNQREAGPGRAAPADAGAATPDLVTAPKPRGRATAHPDTLSLNEHLASQGGLKPDPELKAIYGGDRGPFIPGFGPLIRKSGMSLDDALSSAKQHGYMFDPHDVDNGKPTAGGPGGRGRESLGLIVPDLLNHLDNENRGQKLYKPGHEAATKYDPEQEKHVILGALETELAKAGEDISALDPKLLNRAVEIVHREGTSDVLDAYERAIMEDSERYDAIANARRDNPATADLPGFDDRRAAPGDGGRDSLDHRQAGRPDQSGRGADDPQSRSHGARAAAAADDPRWRELADVRPAEQDPEVIAASREADRLAEPDSLVPESSLTALEKQAADAEAIWRKLEPTLTEKERVLVNDVLDQLKLDKQARDKIITDGAACLVGAIG